MRGLSRGIVLSLIIASVLIVSLFALTAGFFWTPGKTPTWVYRSGEMTNSLAMTPDGKYVVAGSGGSLASGSVTLFDASNGNVIWKLPTDRIIDTLALSSNGSYIVAGGYQLSGPPAEVYEDGAVYFLNNKGHLLWSITTGSSPVFQVLESANGSRIAVDDTSNILYLDGSGHVLWNFSITYGSSLGMAMSSDGSFVSFMAGKVYYLNSSGAVLWSSNGGSFGGSVAGISMTPDGSYIVAAGGDSVYYFDRSGNLIWKDRAYSYVLSAQISDNGTYVSAGTGSAILFYDSKGNLIANYSKSSGTSIFSADGSHVLGAVWGDWGPTILMFTSQGVEQWRYSAGEIHAGAISAKGTEVVASAGQPGTTGSSTIYFFESNNGGNALAGIAGFFWSYSESPLFIPFEYGTIIIVAILVIVLLATVIRNRAKASGSKGQVDVKKMKIVILAIVLLLVGVMFVPALPTANYTYCNRESCSNVTQFSSFTGVEFCLGQSMPQTLAT